MPDISVYKDKKPELRIEEYFAGSTRAWGLFQDRFGTIRRQFTVDIIGVWDEKSRILTLTEDFVYDDGETERRIWTITKTGDDTYIGTAAGVIGTAQGRSAGNAFNFRYDFALPMNGSTLNVHFDDWMYLQPDGVLFNRAGLSKWGVRLGDVYLFFKKSES